MTELFSVEMIHARVAELAAEILNAPEPFEILIPVLEGAWPFTVDLFVSEPSLVANAWEITPVKISSYQGTESRTLQVHTKFPMPDVKGRRVLIIEDIVDTGQTLDYLLTLFHGLGALSVDICALLLKDCPRKYPVPISFHGFTVPADQFVVGYGLDYDGEFRGLPNISILEDQ